MALMKIGEQGIKSLDENSDGKRLCDIYYDQTLVETLREYPWSSATARVRLASIETPEFGYAYAYKLPADFVRLIELYDADGNWDPTIYWELESGNLLTDASGVCLKYTRATTDTLNLDPLCIGAVICKLAAKMAFSRTKSRLLSASLIEEYEKFILPRARSVDTYENRKEIEGELDPWLSSRHGGL